jgi:hypothetical protein
MTALLFLWLALLIALVGLAIGRSRDGALTLCYFLSLSLIHVPGALVYTAPGSDLFGEEPTEVGFQITLAGLAAFIIGAIWARNTGKLDAGIGPMPVSAGDLNHFGWLMFAIGSIAFFVLLPFSLLVPSATVIVASLSTTLVIGIWLRLYSAARGNGGGTLTTLAMLPLLPLATVMTGGFISYGVNWVLSVLAFLFVISRRRIWFYLGAPVAVILGLSFFVAYMGERTGIRDLVWEQKAGYSDRLERIGGIVTNFRLLDLTDPFHRAALDGRLNQNFLVGSGVMRFREGLIDLAYGGTFQLWAFVPRAIWPEKPSVSGGSSVVTDFTGISFSEGTTVGAGQVLEFYFNFGLPGVLAGFLALGFVFRRLDLYMMRAFAVGDKRGILLRAMPGLTLLYPGGNAREIAVATVGALVAAYLILLFERRHSRSNRQTNYGRSESAGAPNLRRSDHLLLQRTIDSMSLWDSGHPGDKVPNPNDVD